MQGNGCSVDHDNGHIPKRYIGIITTRKALRMILYTTAIDLQVTVVPNKQTKEMIVLS